ncbi:RNA methyltransferase [Planococcus sp. APC 3900]|uniref:TRM11 family SAM-dependent methyltransferase n=1 Tax=Planococcus sp. APC 3900 TaxID=3035191 RepID=UPI0025B2A0F8|nr:RNA methyltransferase [Planococcus sp. APC 3900]MDN3438624.1 RNA methyltransferase [Planococcus sp. APC 3900]
MNRLTATGDYLYTYAYTNDEEALCQLEMRSFFGKDTTEKIIKSGVAINPSRSPFIKERIELFFEADSLQAIIEKSTEIDMSETTFKVIFLKINGLSEQDQVDYSGKRDVERQIGSAITGEADVHNPDVTFGLIPFEGRWYFGRYLQSEPIWFKHMKKPREYSTALSTRVARAVANIAVPEPKGVKAIDPCCGIGTVLVEALSMGIDIVGRDINPLVVEGSRENIAHFGLSGDVNLGPIAEVEERYDVAIIDMPYNLYTHATPADQLAILKDAHPFTEKLLVVTIETMDHMVEAAGFVVTDRCIAKKGMFLREILVCQKAV